MLALSRAYLTRPQLVLIDEASLRPWQPLVVDRIYDVLRQLVERGVSLVIVEQYVQKALDLAKHRLHSESGRSHPCRQGERPQQRRDLPEDTSGSRPETPIRHCGGRSLLIDPEFVPER